MLDLCEIDSCKCWCHMWDNQLICRDCYDVSESSVSSHWSVAQPPRCWNHLWILFHLVSFKTYSQKCILKLNWSHQHGFFRSMKCQPCLKSTHWLTKVQSGSELDKDSEELFKRTVEAPKGALSMGGAWWKMTIFGWKGRKGLPSGEGWASRTISWSWLDVTEKFTSWLIKLIMMDTGLAVCVTLEVFFVNHFPEFCV